MYTFILKCVFMLTAVGLLLTSVLGIYMSFKYNRNRTVVWSLLILGTAIPATLLVLMPSS